jgi:polyisoprenoid-binding protein YceI
MPEARVGSRRRTFWASTCMAALLLAACQAVAPPEDSAVMATSTDAGVKVAANAPRFVVDANASEIRLLVYRAGALARLGHNHVITGRVRGEIRAGEAAADSSFRLEIPVDSFVVDLPSARAEEGAEFVADVAEDARQGTRNNMLGKDVLDAANRPLIEIDSVALSGPRWNPTVIARVTLRGVTRDLRFPAAVMQDGDRITVVAGFRIRQTDFDMHPLSVFGGGIQVRDAIDIRLRLAARRAN